MHLKSCDLADFCELSRKTAWTFRILRGENEFFRSIEMTVSFDEKAVMLERAHLLLLSRAVRLDRLAVSCFTRWQYEFIP